MKSVTKSATLLGQKGFVEFLSTLVTGNARNIRQHKLSYFCYNQRILPVICGDKFQKLFSTNSNTGTSSEQTGSTPTHFKELAGKHPLPEVEEEKQLHEERKKSKDYILPHPIWTEEDLHSITISHKEPEGKVDKLAYYTVQALRLSFDIISMYKIGRMTENKWLTRIIMLETVAGVPGMVGAMTRHFHSLRRMRRDHGWIHTLLEEAENERMHLMTALELKQPGIIFRGMVLLMQGIFVNMFFISYLLSPRFCHRFVGYLEEEAVKTYTHCLEHGAFLRAFCPKIYACGPEKTFYSDIKTIDSGGLSIWKTKSAPLIARRYWRLKDDCTMRDVILAIRADEAHHRKVNHTFASMHLDQQNPFEPWERKL